MRLLFLNRRHRMLVPGSGDRVTGGWGLVERDRRCTLGTTQAREGKIHKTRPEIWAGQHRTKVYIWGEALIVLKVLESKREKKKQLKLHWGGVPAPLIHPPTGHSWVPANFVPSAEGCDASQKRSTSHCLPTEDWVVFLGHWAHSHRSLTHPSQGRWLYSVYWELGRVLGTQRHKTALTWLPVEKMHKQHDCILNEKPRHPIPTLTVTMPTAWDCPEGQHQPPQTAHSDNASSLGWPSVMSPHSEMSRNLFPVTFFSRSHVREREGDPLLSGEQPSICALLPSQSAMETWLGVFFSSFLEAKLTDKNCIQWLFINWNSSNWATSKISSNRHKFEFRLMESLLILIRHLLIPMGDT